MKYLVIGAGGTGGCIGAFMGKAGKDVTLIARGEHLRQIKENGIKILPHMKEPYYVKVKASDMENYNETPEVIFVCVKYYSIDETIDFISRVAGKNTIVIPILNVYGTGEKMQERLPDLLVTDGCIYIASQITSPGVIQMNGDIFRLVYGVREPAMYDDRLEAVKADLIDSGITPILSDNIRRDALQKFSYVSPAATCGQFYDVNSGSLQVEGECRETFIALMKEIDLLAGAMGIKFEVDIVETNLKILSTLTPESSTSMQRDCRAGKSSEMDGLIFEVVRMGRKYGVDLPTYEKIAGHFGFED